MRLKASRMLRCEASDGDKCRCKCGLPSCAVNKAASSENRTVIHGENRRISTVRVLPVASFLFHRDTTYYEICIHTPLENTES